jgi:RNA polymerase sigma-70 factor (ECF subfamily)
MGWMQEAELLRRLKKRRSRALEQAIDQYGAYVATVVRNVLGASGTMEDAEELSADVFYTLWTHCETIMPGKLKPWLGAVARNRAKDFLRQRRPVLPMDEDILSIPTDSPETAVLEHAQKQVLFDAIDAMTEPDREIFLRYYYKFETMEEVAQRMQLPIGTVKTKLHRGRKHLKEILTEQEAAQ